MPKGWSTRKIKGLLGQFAHKAEALAVVIDHRVRAKKYMNLNQHAHSYAPRAIRPFQNALFYPPLSAFFEKNPGNFDILIAHSLPTALPVLEFIDRFNHSVLDIVESPMQIFDIRIAEADQSAVADVLNKGSQAIFDGLAERFDVLTCGNPFHQVETQVLSGGREVSIIFNDKTPLLRGQPVQAKDNRARPYLVVYGTSTDAVKVLEIFNALLAAEPTLELCVVNKSAYYDLMDQLHADGAGAATSNNVHLIPDMKSVDLLGFLSGSRGMISGDLDDPNNVNKALPNRFFDAATANVPVFCSEGGYFGHIVDEFGCGMTVKDAPCASSAEIKAFLEIAKPTLAEKYAAARQGIVTGGTTWLSALQSLKGTECRLGKVVIAANKDIAKNPRIEICTESIMDQADAVYLVHRHGWKQL